MNYLYIVGSAEEMTVQIERGDVPKELAAMFDQSGPMPRLFDNDLLFTRAEAYKFGLSRGARFVREVAHHDHHPTGRESQPYKLTADQILDATESVNSDDGGIQAVPVYDIAFRNSVGLPRHAYSPANFPRLPVAPVNGLVSDHQAFRLPVPGFERIETDPVMRSANPLVPDCLAYAGNGLVFGASGYGPLHAAVQNVWGNGKRNIPLSVKVYHVHPSGRYFTLASDQVAASLTAGVDATGVPIGYFKFIASTLLPRLVDINPDGVPCSTGARKVLRDHWAKLFGDPMMYRDQPSLSVNPSLPRDRDKRVVLENVVNGRHWSYRYQVDGTYAGGTGGWYLIDDHLLAVAV